MLNGSEKQHHDMKSTLMSIKAYTQLIMRKTRTKLDKNDFDYIIRLDKQIDTLIKQIKKLADK